VAGDGGRRLGEREKREGGERENIRRRRESRTNGGCGGEQK